MTAHGDLEPVDLSVLTGSNGRRSSHMRSKFTPTPVWPIPARQWVGAAALRTVHPLFDEVLSQLGRCDCH